MSNSSTVARSDAAERALLSAILTSRPDDAPTVMGIVESFRPGWFGNKKHELIADAIKAVVLRGESPGATQVADELQARGRLTEAGGVAELGRLLEEGGLVAQASDYRRIIHDHFLRRHLGETYRTAYRWMAEGQRPEDVAEWVLNTVSEVTRAPATPGQSGSVRGFLPFDQLQALGERKIEWLWRGFLARGMVTVLAGPAKVGKSTFVGHLVKALVSGAPFLERETTACRVLWWAGDEHVFLVHNRLLRLGVREGGGLRAREYSSMRAEFRAIMADMKTHQCDVLILDSLSRFWEVVHENDSREVARSLDPIINFARGSGSAVLIIHHTRKMEPVSPRNPEKERSADEIRGSSALQAEVDVLVTMDQEGDLGRRVLWTRSRLQEEVPRRLKIELNTLTGEYEVDHYVPPPVPRPPARRAERPTEPAGKAWYHED